MFEYSNQTVNWQTRNEVIETKEGKYSTCDT